MGWAFAEVRHPARALFAAIADAALRRLRDFGGVDLSAVAWAFAEANAQHVELATAIDEVLRAGIRGCDDAQVRAFGDWCDDELKLPRAPPPPPQAPAAAAAAAATRASSICGGPSPPRRNGEEPVGVGARRGGGAEPAATAEERPMEEGARGAAGAAAPGVQPGQAGRVRCLPAEGPRRVQVGRQMPSPPPDAGGRRRSGDARGRRPECINQRGLTDAISAAPKELMLRFFDAWGDQMHDRAIGNIWNKLGQQLREAPPRGGWRPTARCSRGCGGGRWSCCRRARRRQMANIVHGAATLGLEAGDELFRVAAQAAVGSRLRGFEAQGISNTVWAFATAGHAAPPLFDEAAAAAVARIRDFGPQDLANTTWAFATLDHAAPALFDAVAAAAVELLRGERGVAEKYRGNNDSFAPQTLSNLVWAFATVGHSAPALFDAVAAAFVQQLGRSNQQHIANTVWAFTAATRRPRSSWPSPGWRRRS